MKVKKSSRTNKSAQKLISTSEYNLFAKSKSKPGSLNVEQLKKYIVRSRKLSDKYRDLTRKQQRAKPGTGPTKTKERYELFKELTKDFIALKNLTHDIQKKALKLRKPILKTKGKSLKTKKTPLKGVSTKSLRNKSKFARSGTKRIQGHAKARTRRSQGRSDS
jgi:hypothetical protein